jgi:hypothetical protein
MKIYRNGDWTFVETTKQVSSLEKHQGNYVFAEGEATGHLHTISVPEVDDMKITKLPDGSYIVDLRADATVAHPEHSLRGDLKVAPGTYHLVQRREKDWFTLATRKVID